MRRLVLPIAVVLVTAVLLALGVWQVQRLMWKTALIETVNARTTAPAQALEAGPSGWPVLTKANDEYRRVRLSGRFLNDREVQVYALTEAGAGYWVMTPFATDGGTIFVNRGYVPTDRKAPETRIPGQVSGPTTVTGLVRLSETKGWLFSQPNAPADDRWYLRDTQVMARARDLGAVPAYFIDAEASNLPGGWPKGGMTVVRFTNNHLTYALTWFAMAAGLAGATLWLTLRPKTKTPL
ncbi:SURF1 family protein [Asticcacaulis sp. BYS171W]|uniref:SURF1-like protein n=1 Tax=Asticcacaulis aquaticus TaxID=2984212 RepID=A0ABT5HYG6_9CAUL|nr:SURF1 family protein [Asticcacaulis aquaticus]MDC7685120.1 SURF1 family protein [Asticcacaulis aquaticus]